MSELVAIIGGSILPQLNDLKVKQENWPETPFGKTSSPLKYGNFNDREVIFLDRHGAARATPPHLINYRANMWALKELGVKYAIGLSIVGGIRSDMTTGHFVFPDQLIDYTYDRPNTCYEKFDMSQHIDFTYPYDQGLHSCIIDAAQMLHLDYTDDATYAVTQGPRFETMAEITRLERDGCDVVGMTAMPEALLARELNIKYASIAVVGSKAAGRTDGLSISIEQVRKVVNDSVTEMRKLLKQVIINL